MSDAPFVDHDGKPLADYNAYKDYYKNNSVAPLCDMVQHDGYDVCITTRQSGFKFGFKTIVTCEDNHDCVYHDEIRECNGETESIALHVIIKNAIESGEVLP